VGQTENITILFTDLVGSTELSSSLTPEAADEVRRAHFSALRDAIAATGGTEVKNLGDGLMVGFDATAPALSCAVQMQQAIDRHNRKSESAWDPRRLHILEARMESWRTRRPVQSVTRRS